MLAHGAALTSVVGGPAFTFGYAEHVELLRAAGAEVVVVDPLRDEALPAGTAALVLPGGFPEEHVGALAANASLRAAVRRSPRPGRRCTPSAAASSTSASSWTALPMCGVLPARRGDDGPADPGLPQCRGAGRLRAAPAGARVTGHEFHRCAVTGARAAPHGPRAGRWRGADARGLRPRRRARLVPAHPPGRRAGGGGAVRGRGRGARPRGRAAISRLSSPRPPHALLPRRAATPGTRSRAAETVARTGRA